MAKDKKDAIRIAINAGIDMSMDPYSVEFCILLKELVNEGKVSMARIDDAVRRILRAKYRLGLFDEPNTGGKGFSRWDRFLGMTAAMTQVPLSPRLARNLSSNTSLPFFVPFK